MMNRAIAILCLGSLTALACVLNPHPLPPEEESAAPNGGSTTKGTGDEPNRAEANPSLSGQADAALPPVGPDAGIPDDCSADAGVFIDAATLDASQDAADGNVMATSK